MVPGAVPGFARAAEASQFLAHFLDQVFTEARSRNELIDGDLEVARLFLTRSRRPGDLFYLLSQRHGMAGLEPKVEQRCGSLGKLNGLPCRSDRFIPPPALPFAW